MSNESYTPPRFPIPGQSAERPLSCSSSIAAKHRERFRAEWNENRRRIEELERRNRQIESWLDEIDGI